MIQNSLTLKYFKLRSVTDINVKSLLFAEKGQSVGYQRYVHLEIQCISPSL